MNFRIIVKPKCKGKLEKMNPKTAERIKNRLKQIQSMVNTLGIPPEHFIKYIQKYKVWSLRVGYYRIYCDFDRSKNVLYALTILPRDRAYERWGR